MKESDWATKRTKSGCERDFDVRADRVGETAGDLVCKVGRRPRCACISPEREIWPRTDVVQPTHRLAGRDLSRPSFRRVVEDIRQADSSTATSSGSSRATCFS